MFSDITVGWMERGTYYNLEIGPNLGKRIIVLSKALNSQKADAAYMLD